MPWIWFLIFVVGVYVVVKLLQGLRDLVSWWREGRVLTELQQKSREHRRQGHPMSKPPVLKERPPSTMPAAKAMSDRARGKN